MKLKFCPKSGLNFVLFLLALVAISAEESSERKYPIPYALSPVYLKYLEWTEVRFYNLVKNLNLYEEDPELEQVAQYYLQEYEDRVVKPHYYNRPNVPNGQLTFLENHQNPGAFVLSENPILSIQMISRFLKFGNLMNFAAPDLLEIDAIPTTGQIQDAIQAFFHLQFIYDLDANDLANGIIYGIPTNARLSLRATLELAQFAKILNYYTLALEWFNVALKKLQTSEENESDSKSLGESIINDIRLTIYDHNQFLLNIMGEERSAIEKYNCFTSSIKSVSYSTYSQLTQRKQVVRDFLERESGNERESKNSDKSTELDAKMLLLCGDTDLQSEKVKRTLKCHLDTSRNPYWKINPLKIEELNEKPEVVRIYEIISEKEMEDWQNLAKYELEKAPRDERATVRTAGYAWLPDNMLADVNFLKRVEFITGLNVVGGRAKGVADDLQVAAYAFGGHVAAHLDSQSQVNSSSAPGCSKVDEEMKHRIATFLVYLNDVEAGGNTVFPRLGVSIKPVKGSAILWRTNLRNGQVDERMLHLACPVVLGHKWIATKWIRSNTNVFKYPCGLTPEV